MGCDIHGFVEINIYVKSNFKYQWVVLERLDIPRNYGLFGLMGNEHRGTKVLFPKRGLPYDLSPEVQIQNTLWGVDGHTHSWLSFKEVSWVLGRHKKLFPDHYDSEHYSPIYFQEMFWCENEIKQLEKRIQLSVNDIRLIYWMDN